MVNSQEQLEKEVAGIVTSIETKRLLETFGLVAKTITWEDTARTKGSCWGPNISDCTLKTKSGTRCPVIRTPNFGDKTYDVPISSFQVRAGQQLGRESHTVSLRDYISNISQYTGLSVKDSLLHERDEKILVSSQCCVLPLDKGNVEFAVEIFNYQSHEDESAVLVLVASSQGVSAHTVSSNYEKLLFIENLKGRWFRAQRLADTSGRKVEEFSNMSSEEKSENYLMIYQIPLVVTKKRISTIFFNDSTALSAPRRSRGIDFAKIEKGSSSGTTHDLSSKKQIVRDHRFPIRCTVQYYRVTDNPKLTHVDVQDIAKQLVQVEKKSVAEGSLVFSSSLESTSSTSLKPRTTEPELPTNFSP